MDARKKENLGYKRAFLDLGKQPLANGFLKTEEEFGKEFFFNLGISFAEEVGLVTLSEYVDPPKMFHENYAYVASQSQTMKAHFKKLAEQLKSSFSLNSTSRVLEIGSNDGIFIGLFRDSVSTAVEPCGNFARLTEELGIKTFSEFWSKELSEKLVEERGRQDIIFAANCMCHIPSIVEAFEAVSAAISDEGVFIFEDPTLLHVLQRGSYDQFYDEHAHIFSLTALKQLLTIAGLKVFHVENLDVHGGSMRLYASKASSSHKINPSVDDQLLLEKFYGLGHFSTYEFFAEKVHASKRLLVKLISSVRDRGIPVVAYGATSKSTTVFNFCEIGSGEVECIFDTTPGKQGTFSPGVHIPVKEYTQEWFRHFPKTPFAFLGAWNFVNEIKSKEAAFLASEGAFFTHVPYVSIL